jgi:hypothetical protein
MRRPARPCLPSRVPWVARVPDDPERPHARRTSRQHHLRHTDSRPSERCPREHGQDTEAEDHWLSAHGSARKAPGRVAMRPRPRHISLTTRPLTRRGLPGPASERSSGARRSSPAASTASRDVRAAGPVQPAPRSLPVEIPQPSYGTPFASQFAAQETCRLQASSYAIARTVGIAIRASSPNTRAGAARVYAAGRAAGGPGCHARLSRPTYLREAPRPRRRRHQSRGALRRRPRIPSRA